MSIVIKYSMSIYIWHQLIKTCGNSQFMGTNDLNQGVMMERAFTDYLKHTEPRDLMYRDEPTFGNDTILYTHISPIYNISNFKRLLKNSYSFKYKAKYTFTANLNLFSITKGFYPQLNIYEMINNQMFEVICTSCLRQFPILKDKTYIFEIGTDFSLKSDPFISKKQGGFICIISSKIRPFMEIMDNETIKIGWNGYFGLVQYIHGHGLMLHDMTKSTYNFGTLNYHLTPYYNSAKKAISLFYHSGDNRMSNGKSRYTTVEIRCNHQIDIPIVYYGQEIIRSEYFFSVDSERLCEITNIINQ